MRKKLTALAALLVTALAVSACGPHNVASGNRTENQAQQADSFNLINNQPPPVFSHSQIRQEAIDIEKAQANGVQTTTFFMNFSDKPESSCPSIGAPVATTTQLTNPLQQVRDPNGGNVPGSSVLNQMDPNGVYTGDSTGTYVMCINSAGQTYAQYWEGNVRVVFGPAVWDDATNGPKLVGQPPSVFSDVKAAKK